MGYAQTVKKNRAEADTKEVVCRVPVFGHGGGKPFAGAVFVAGVPDSGHHVAAAVSLGAVV